MNYLTRRLALVVTTLLLAQTWRVCGQGTIQFNNRVPPNVFARVTFLDGTPVGAGFTAQLYGGPPGTAIENLTPLFPTTMFRTSEQRFLGYVIDRDVEVPNIPAGAQATVLMRAFNGPEWEISSCRGESNPIILHLGGVTQPGAQLLGLQPFQVNCIPEPSSGLLFGFAVGSLLLGRRWLGLSRTTQSESSTQE